MVCFSQCTPTQRIGDTGGACVLVSFTTLSYPPLMPDAEKLTPADPSDVADALASGLRFQGRKRVHNADEIMAEIVAERLVTHLSALASW
jgi:hypothetical protein